MVMPEYEVIVRYTDGQSYSTIGGEKYSIILNMANHTPDLFESVQLWRINDNVKVAGWKRENPEPGHCKMCGYPDPLHVKH